MLARSCRWKADTPSLSVMAPVRSLMRRWACLASSPAVTARRSLSFLSFWSFILAYIAPFLDAAELRFCIADHLIAAQSLYRLAGLLASLLSLCSYIGTQGVRFASSSCAVFFWKKTSLVRYAL